MELNMANISRMTGTPWHVDALRKDEKDDRRHKSRCVYYRKADESCGILNARCPGSAHCKYYSEDTGTQKSKSANSTCERAVPFHGTAKIKLKNISVPAAFYKKKNSREIGNIIKHYKKYHTLLEKVTVQCVDGKYELVDGFSTYEAARIMLLDEIPATFSEARKKHDNNRTKPVYHLNQWVEYKTVGIGRIIRIDDEFITIRFTDGIEKTYSIKICQQNGLLKVL